MPELTVQSPQRRYRIRYRGRLGQTAIFLGKLMRMFLYQNDWKVLPMSALIAGLVGLVIRSRFFISMEGTLMSALAVACVCVWNGCFNSIQVICREREVIKREHRAGMHISSYIQAHMIYQALLCLLQTVISIYVTVLVGVRYPAQGMLLPQFLPEFAVSVFLITYAADMMSLWISSLCHTTTAAMTVMPVVLIFQLVFSGGLLTLPQRAEPITRAIISNYGLKLIAAQADCNGLPLNSGWNTVQRMRYSEITGSVTVGQILDVLEDEDDPAVQEFRAVKIADVPFLGTVTVGRAVDMIAADEAQREREITFRTTPDRLIRTAGEDAVREYVIKKTSEASYVDAYEHSFLNVVGYWLSLILFALAFAALSVISLEFIDRDRR